MIKEAIRRTEAAFENSGYWIHDHPKRVILMMLLIVVFLASQLPSIQFDTSTESFFEKDDPTLLEYDAFREQFGRDEIVLALIHPKDVFEITFFEKLKAFHPPLGATKRLQRPPKNSRAQEAPKRTLRCFIFSS